MKRKNQQLSNEHLPIILQCVDSQVIYILHTSHKAKENKKKIPNKKEDMKNIIEITLGGMSQYLLRFFILFFLVFFFSVHMLLSFI